MKRKDYSIAQIFAAVKLQEIVKTASIMNREPDIAYANILPLEPGEAREPKESRDGNTKLRKLVADQSLHEVIL